MNEAIIKWKINVLHGVIAKMRNANNTVNKLNASIKNLKEILGDNIIIDDKIAYKEYPENGISKTKEVSNQINGRIIPSLYYTIDQLKKELDS
jgi:hypothetical protein